MNSICKKVLSVILSICLILPMYGIMSVFALSESEIPPIDNSYAGEYLGVGRGASKWSDVSQSYIYENGSDLVRVYFSDGKLVIVTTDRDGGIVSADIKQAELPLFGGFFAGAKYNFVVFGQDNPEESDDKVVVRAVKYSKSWDRLGACDIRGVNTHTPFDGGSLRMDETGGMLYIHTSHLMYTTSDGLNHQANMSFAINEESMKLADSASEVWNLSTGYVSHSFNQFIKTDGSYIYRVDHGDANPRGIVLTRGVAGKVSDKVSSLMLSEFDGSYGDNETGVSVGGMELTNDSVIVAYAKTERDASGIYSDYLGNIYLAIADKGLENVRTLRMTSYDAYSGLAAYTPQIVKFSDDLFALLWTVRQKDADGTETAYVFINSDGKILGETEHSRYLVLSDCQPVVLSDGSAAVWFTGDGSSVRNYSISPACALKCKSTGVYSHAGAKTVDIAASCLESGYNNIKVCSLCGAVLEEGDYIAPLGHAFKNGSCIRCGVSSPSVVFTSVLDEENSVLTVTVGAENAKSASSVVTSFCIPDGLELIGFSWPSDNGAGSVEYLDYGSYLEFRCVDQGDFSDNFNFVELTFSIVSPHDTYRFVTDPDITPYWQESNGENIFISADYIFDPKADNSGGENGGGNDEKCSHVHTTVIEAKQPTCTQDGCTMSIVCSDCGEVLTPSVTIPAKGHSYSNGVCKVCGAKDPNYTPPAPDSDKLELKNTDICVIDYDKNIIYVKSPSPSGISVGVFSDQFKTNILSGSDPDVLLSNGSVLNYGDESYNIIILGDVNSDGKITASDARIALRISARLELADENMSLASDLNSDSKVTATEARQILRFSARLTNEL